MSPQFGYKPSSKSQCTCWLLMTLMLCLSLEELPEPVKQGMDSAEHVRSAK